MPAKRSAMRKIKEILRLKFEAKFSHERIAAATGASKGAVSNYVQRALQKGLSWPLPEDLDESALERGCCSDRLRHARNTRSRRAPPNTPMRRPAGPRACRTGSLPTSARLNFFWQPQISWFLTT